MAIFNNIMDKAKPRTKKLTLYTVLEVLAVLIMCFVGGCFDWVHLKFTFDKFGTAQFYESVFQKWILYSCALLIGYLFKIEKEELNNNDYYKELQLYKEWLKVKKESFVDFIENVFNPNTKKRYIKLHFERKLLKLDKRAKDQYKVEFNDAVKSGDFVNWKWSDEKAKKYADERIRLTQLCSKDYIEENWKTIDVNYPSVSPHIFTESLRKNIKPDDEYKVENKTAQEMGRSVARKFFMVLGVSIVFSLFILNPSANELLEEAHGWLVVIINYILRVAMIIGNFTIGMYTGKGMFDENFILPIQNRIRILMEYANWLKVNNIKNTWADNLNETLQQILKAQNESQEDKKAVDPPKQEDKKAEEQTEFIEVEMTEQEMIENGLIK